MSSGTDDTEEFNTEKLYAIAVISNPARYKRRYELYKRFEAYILQNPRVVLITVEVAYADRPFQITNSANPHHVQLRTPDELWHKENMINIGYSHLISLYPKAKYICWIDADIQFIRPDWAEETIHKLQHYPVVQMFSHAMMLNYDNSPTSSSVSFTHAYRQSLESFDPSIVNKPVWYGEYAKTPHRTGFGWAYTRECFDKIGGMLDQCVVGSADYHMAAAFVNAAEHSISSVASPEFKKFIMNWQDNAYPYVQGRIGYVEGTIVHYWHGESKDRRYRERWNIVREFDPEKHLIRDWSQRGLLKFSKQAHATNIPRFCHEYMGLRNEDAQS